MDSNIVWLALIVLISYSIQAMSGFGSTILALTLGVHLYPIEVLLPVLVPLDLLVNLYIVTRHHHHLNLSLLSRKIIPAMGVGLLAGIMLGEWLHHQIDEYRFKIFIFAVLLFAGLSIIIA